MGRRLAAKDFRGARAHRRAHGRWGRGGEEPGSGRRGPGHGEAPFYLFLCARLSATLQLRDDAVVSAEDLAGNFFLDAASVGQNRAASSAPAAQELNPRVNVVVETASPASLTVDELRAVHLVICCRDRIREAAALDELCTQAGVPFFAVGASGFLGYICCRVEGHVYCLEGHLDEKLVMPASLPLSALYTDPLPSSGRRMTDSMKQLQMQWKTDSSPTVPGLAPVCAIVGGVAGQQAIRILTQVGRPLDSVFVYNAMEHVGKHESLLKPRKE